MAVLPKHAFDSFWKVVRFTAVRDTSVKGVTSVTCEKREAIRGQSVRPCLVRLGEQFRPSAMEGKLHRHQHGQERPTKRGRSGGIHSPANDVWCV